MPKTYLRGFPPLSHRGQYFQYFALILWSLSRVYTLRSKLNCIILCLVLKDNSWASKKSVSHVSSSIMMPRSSCHLEHTFRASFSIKVCRPEYMHEMKPFTPLYPAVVCQLQLRSEVVIYLSVEKLCSVWTVNTWKGEIGEVIYLKREHHPILIQLTKWPYTFVEWEKTDNIS